MWKVQTMNFKLKDNDELVSNKKTRCGVTRCSHLEVYKGRFCLLNLESRS